MDHIVLNVRDDRKMLAFYTGILELAGERLDAYREGKVPFPSVRLNADTIIDLFPERMWRDESTDIRAGRVLNHFCMVMERSEWDALLQRLQASRVRIEEGPVSRWGARGSGTSVYFRDPEGNTIEARYYGEDDGAKDCLLGS